MLWAAPSQGVKHSVLVMKFFVAISFCLTSVDSIGISTRGLRSFSGSTTVASAKSAAKGLTANRGLSRGRGPHRGGLGRSRSATIKFGLQMQLIFSCCPFSCFLSIHLISKISSFSIVSHFDIQTCSRSFFHSKFTISNPYFKKLSVPYNIPFL